MTEIVLGPARVARTNYSIITADYASGFVGSFNPSHPVPNREKGVYDHHFICPSRFNLDEILQVSRR